MNKSYKICFVCTGNACRSPFAECVTKKLLADAGIEDMKCSPLVHWTGARILVMLPWWMWRRNWAMN